MRQPLVLRATARDPGPCGDSAARKGRSAGTVTGGGGVGEAARHRRHRAFSLPRGSPRGGAGRGGPWGEGRGTPQRGGAG